MFHTFRARIAVPILLSLIISSVLPVNVRAANGDVLGSTTIGSIDWGGAIGSSTSLGDFDGDGIVDFVAGLPSISTSKGGVGFAFLNADGTLWSSSRIEESFFGFDVSLDVGDQVGACVGTIGDIDGNGYPDLVVGAPGDDDGGSARGAVYIFLLELLLGEEGQKYLQIDSFSKISNIEGLENGDAFGSACDGIGDFDGDDVPDIIVGARGDDDGESNAGAAYIITLNEDGTLKAIVNKIANGSDEFGSPLENTDEFGSVITNIGDLDGDGVTDVIVGARGDDGVDNLELGIGALYTLLLNSDGSVKGSVKITEGSGGFSGDLDIGDGFGSSSLGGYIANIGDLDGNGTEDLAVGAPSDDHLVGFDNGAVWILFMNPDGTVKEDKKIIHDVIFDQFGRAVVALDDFNGDNIHGDIAVFADSAGWSVLHLDGTPSADEEPTPPSNPSYIVPRNTSLTSTGSCTSSGKVIIELSGQNVREVAVSQSEYFHGAEWVRFEPNTQGIMSYELALSDISSTKTIYALFRSATKNLSPVHSVAINLADGCGAPSDDNDEEELTGGLMKSTDAPAVYYIEETDSGLIRRPFFNEAIYFTYFNDFDDVIEVSPDEMAQIPMGKPMLPKAGDTLLLKFFYNSKVYTITEGPSPSHPILRHIPNEQTAVELFGSDWNKRVLELPDWMMMHAEIGGGV